jgi:hypothetical protein
VSKGEDQRERSPSSPRVLRRSFGGIVKTDELVYKNWNNYKIQRNRDDLRSKRYIGVLGITSVSNELS